MAEHSLGPRRGAGALFKRAMSDYRTKVKYRDLQSQNALQYYKGHPERSQKAMKSGELGTLERLLLDDAQRPNATTSPQWELKKYLGRGGYGQVTMWERHMGPQEEPLRLACKETVWDGFFRDWCEEAQLTQKLNEVGCVNVVKVIDWVVNPERIRTRILYEYLPHGAFNVFIKFYQDQCTVTMPEAFIWHVFHSLATALCYNAHGTTAEERIAGWEAIIHRDIKPANILVADPDLNNRPLYPTLKLADYGLAYAIPSEDVRNLKTKTWSEGTVPYVPPEAVSSVRRDPSQTPHEKVYSESDIFSVGCIILEMMRMTFGRYHAKSKAVLDHEYPFPYQSLPYSEILRNLAMDCIKKDVRSRPRVREVYQRTKYYADLWYGKVSGPVLGKPQKAYAGQVLWNSDLRNRFETDMHFRWSYTIHNDWFYNHTATVAKLYRTATDPGKANVPRDDGVLAIGNGLLYREDLATKSLRPKRPEELSINVFNHQGNLLKRRDGKKTRRVVRPQLKPPTLIKNWRIQRAQMLRRLVMTAEGDEQTRLVREVLDLEVCISQRPTLQSLEAFRAVQHDAKSRHLPPRIQRAMKEFADEMIAYLTGETATKPRNTPKH